MNCKKIDIINIATFYDKKEEIFQLTAMEYADIKRACSYHENRRSAIVEVLKIIQKNRGWISDNIIELVAQILDISAVDVEGVATFYNQIFRQPVGRHIVRYCDSVVCYLVGCEKVKIMLEKLLNITVGQTTIDNRFTLLPTCCLGACNLAPVIMIDEDMHDHVKSENLIQLLEFYK